MGKSVVDSIAVNHNALSYCTHFQVVTMTDCLDKYQLHKVISEKCKVPNHLIVAYYTCIMECK